MNLIWIIILPIAILAILFLLCLGASSIEEYDESIFYVFKPEFEEKLRKLGVRAQFMKNIVKDTRGICLGKRLKDLKETQDWDYFITWAFNWEKSPEGFDFWQKISIS